MERERTRPPTHPGGILQRQYLAPLHMTVEQLSQDTGVDVEEWQKLLVGDVGLNIQTAVALAQRFQTTWQLWANLQKSYDDFYTQ